MKKVFLYILIPIFAILLMSHNTYAALSIPVRLVNGNYDASILMGGNTNPQCVYVPSNHSFAQNSCSDLDIIAQNFQVTFNNGTYQNTYIVDIPLYFTLNTNNNALDAWLRNLTLSSSDNTHWSIVDVDFQMLSSSSGLAHIYLKSYGSAHTDNTVQFTSNNNYILSLHPGEVIGIGNTAVWQIVDSSADTQSIVDAIGDISPAPSAQDIADAVNAPDEQAANDIQNQSPSDIGNSTNAQTQSLLDTFGSFVSAIASISPSNCDVDFDLGHIDFGKQNLCSVELPNVFTGVTSIIVIMFTIPFVYHLVNRILGLIREMQT